MSTGRRRNIKAITFVHRSRSAYCLIKASAQGDVAASWSSSDGLTKKLSAAGVSTRICSPKATWRKRIMVIGRSWCGRSDQEFGHNLNLTE